MIIPCSNGPSSNASPQMAEQMCRTAGTATIQNSAPGCWNPLKEKWRGWAASSHFLLTPSSNTVPVLTQKWFWPCGQTNMVKKSLSTLLFLSEYDQNIHGRCHCSWRALDLLLQALNCLAFGEVTTLFLSLQCVSL